MMIIFKMDFRDLEEIKTHIDKMNAKTYEQMESLANNVLEESYKRAQVMMEQRERKEKIEKEREKPFTFKVSEEQFKHPGCPASYKPIQESVLKPHRDSMDAMRHSAPEMMKKKHSAPLTVHERDIKDIWVQTETGYMKLREYFATQGYVKVVWESGK